jgi:hypothetical protein
MSLELSPDEGLGGFVVIDNKGYWGRFPGSLFLTYVGLDG